MKNWLNSRTVLVTGASSGIGKEITKILIEKYNCFVIGVARTEENLKKIKNVFNKNNSCFEYIVADISNEQDWKIIYNFAITKNCTVVINCAGTMLPFCKAENIEQKQVERVFKTNFYATYFSYKTFCDYLKQQKDCAMINICSASAICSIPGQSVYSASKSAQVAFSKIVASEQRKNFFISTILPGFTKTNLFFSKDNSKPIFDEKSLKLINKFCMSSQKMAKKIVRSIAHKKRYKVIGKDAKLLRLINFFAPNKSTDLYLKIFKKTKFDCFEELK